MRYFIMPKEYYICHSPDQLANKSCIPVQADTTSTNEAPTSALCADCGLFPAIEGSEECRYCVNEFNDWLAEQEAQEPEEANKKTRYLVTTYQIVELT
jgi:hypothetical protein